MASKRANASQVHEHFFPKQPQHGDYRFCKHCWKDVPFPEDFTVYAKPGIELAGCVLCQDGSTASMKKHLARNLPKHIDPELANFQEAAKKKGSDEQEPRVVDHQTTMDYAHDVVLEDLQTVGLTDKAGTKRFRNKYLKGLGDRRQVRKAVEKWYQTGSAIVKKTVEGALASGCKFTLGADGWKSKGSNRKHFLAVLAWWTGLHWEQNVACLGVEELVEKCDHAYYMQAIDKVVRRMGVTLESTVAFISDHEGALRLATSKAGYCVLGCFCHGVQLPPRHVLPPTKVRSPAIVADVESSSESSSDSSTDSSSEGEAEVGPPAAGAKRKRRVYEPDECERLRNAYTPLFAKSRAIIKWHVNNDTEYNATEKEARDQNRPFKRFCRETATRWSSQQDSLCSVVYNDKALKKKKQEGTYRGPQLFSEAECRQAAQLCGVLSAHKVATKMLDRDDEGASACQPVWSSILKQLGEQKVPLPAGCGHWGYQEGCSKFYLHGDLSELALATVAWLRGDTQKTYDKFNKGAASEVLQRRCSFLDPRYKALAFLTDEQRAAVHQDVKTIVIRRMEASPEWQEMKKLKAEAAAAAENAAEAKSKDPEELPLAALATFDEKRARKLKVPELRSECNKRRLCDAGLKEALVEKLVAWRPPLVAVLSPAAPAAPCASVESGCFAGNDVMKCAQPDAKHVGEQAVDLLKAANNEIKAYLREPTHPLKESSRQWWRDNQHRFPLLAITARDHMSIPGSSSSLERLFSRFGLVLNPRRNRIKPELAMMIIFCHENIRRRNF